MVEDLQPAGKVTPWQETAYDIHIALPQEADLIGQHQDAALYEAGRTYADRLETGFDMYY